MTDPKAGPFRIRDMIGLAERASMPDIIAVRRKVLRHLRAGEADKACAVMTQHLRNLNEYLEQKPWAKAVEGAAAAAKKPKKAASPRAAAPRPTRTARA